MPNLQFLHPSVLPTVEREDEYKGTRIVTYRHWRATDLTDAGSPVAIDEWVSVMADQPISLAHAKTSAWQDPETHKITVTYSGNRGRSYVWQTNESDRNTILAHSKKSAASCLSNAKRKLDELAKTKAGVTAPTGRRSAELGHLLGATVKVRAFGGIRRGMVVDTTKTRVSVEFVRNRQGGKSTNWFRYPDEVELVTLAD